MESAQIKDYRFYAFISYSRKNEKAAKWLQKKLESYRLPTVLQKQYGDLPKKLVVFRDKTDIGVGGTVERALSRELADSKKLIVVCSPEAAKSEYVEYEIASFLKLGRSPDDILPFIVDGEIDASSEKNCFTPTLASLNLNAANAKQEGKNNAFVRLLASLLGIKYDDLKRRERVRAIRRNILLNVAAFFALAFVGTLAWYLTPHTKYYANYVTRWGVPEGVGPELSEDDVRKRPDGYFEIQYKCFKPVLLRKLTREGKLLRYAPCEIPSDLFVEAKYVYSNLYRPLTKKKDYKLVRVVAKIDSSDSNFPELQNFQIEYQRSDSNEAYEYFFYDSDGKMPRGTNDDFLSSRNFFCNDFSSLLNGAIDAEIISKSKSNITRLKISYDGNGFEKKIVFLNSYNQNVCDKNNISGVLREYNDYGLIEREDYLYDEIDDIDFFASKHVLYAKFSFSEQACLQSIEYFGRPKITLQNKRAVLEERPIMNPSRNYSKQIVKRDYAAEGNLIATYKWLDQNGKPCFNAFTNCSSTEIFFNKNGAHEKEIDRTSEGFVEIVSEKTENNIEILTSKLNGKFESRQEVLYDDNGNVKQMIFFDESGDVVSKEKLDRMLLQDGSFLISQQGEGGKNEKIYDRYGRLVKEKLIIYELNDEVSAFLNYSGVNRTLCFYHNGLLFSSIFGFAKGDFIYDSDGFLQDVLFTDEAGNKVNHPQLEFSEMVQTWQNGILRHSEYKNSKGKFMNPSYVGFAVYDATLNSDNKYRMNVGYFMADGSDCMKNFFSRKARYPYDSGYISDSDVVVEKYISGRAANLWNVYDGDGNRIYQFNKDVRENGCSEIYVYDSYGRIVSSELRGSDQKLKNYSGKNYAMTKVSFHSNGLYKCIDYFDEHENRVSAFEFNEEGELLSE